MEPLHPCQSCGTPARSIAFNPKPAKLYPKVYGFLSDSHLCQACWLKSIDLLNLLIKMPSSGSWVRWLRRAKLN